MGLPRAAVAAALLLVLCMAAGASAGPVGSRHYYNFFREGEEIRVHVYVDEHTDPFHDEGVLFTHPPAHTFTSVFAWNGTVEEMKVNISIPREVRANQTGLNAHVIITKGGIGPNPFTDEARADPEYFLKLLHRTVPLTRLQPEIPIVRKRFLLTDPAPPPVDTSLDVVKPILPYWAPRLAVFLVLDTNTYPAMTNVYVSQLLLYALQQTSSVDDQSGAFLPIVHVDELGTLTKDLMPVNMSAEVLPLSISLGFLGTTRFEWMVKMEHSIKMHQEMGTPDSEMEEVRRMFSETDSRLLVVTLVVSAVHLIFDMLAFGHDIHFWRKLKSTKGVSVRAIGMGLGMESIVFCYLWDSGTSFLVLVTVGGGVIVGLWKLYRAHKLHSAVQPKAGADSEAEEVWDEEEMSQEFDAIASKYMYVLLGPPILGYAVFSLVYMQQKSWMSWALESAVSVVYAVGFMQMTPQLFLNYKYKSVDHLPWKALIYRALNTFIDDLFAFVIKMPGLHRLSVFRDDIVFFIYLYQRWIYTKRRPAPGTVKPKEEKAGGGKGPQGQQQKKR